ncbi:MAG TPA: DUF488 domain-containing protein [Clostridia bacterium]|nr:DUF488 domain-containing protein [Clostridia bacterium]
MIKLKRAYEPYDESDGYRILVDRLWPRGVSKEDAKIDEWAKDIAPSTQLRKWYSHEVPKWPVFGQMYTEELQKNEGTTLRAIKEKQAKETVTLVYAAKDEAHTHALVLKDFIQNMKG